MGPLEHSNAILTNPDDISLTRVDVDTASSMINTGADLGSYWTAKLTCPRRLPNRVPVTLRPRVGVIERWEGIVSHRQVGRIMGKEMRLMSDRKKAEMTRRGFDWRWRTTEVLVLVVWWLGSGL